MLTHTKSSPVSVEATVTSKGQVTLPKELRKHLGIQKGSKIRFSISASGAAKVEPVLYELEDLWRIADHGDHSGPIVTFEEMDSAKSLRKW
jgi:antitoxin PrlF